MLPRRSRPPPSDACAAPGREATLPAPGGSPVRDGAGSVLACVATSTSVSAVAILAHEGEDLALAAGGSIFPVGSSAMRMRGWRTAARAEGDAAASPP